MSASNQSNFHPVDHITRPDWLFTPEGEPRGYIQPESLQELWFHTGTICNLSCPFCLEGSAPGDNRLNQMNLDDARPFMDAALSLGVRQFSFTGGEPFVTRDFIRILDCALDRRPCLVLTNATRPLAMRLDDVAPLLDKPHPLSLRVSLDFPDEKRHDAGRGRGNFALALETCGRLHRMGFAVSVARQRDPQEKTDAVEARYRQLFRRHGLPGDTRLVSFPDFLTPGSIADVPHITENCMTTYHDASSRGRFMCNFSKMVIKKDGRLRVYACTLVDDDEDYDLGETLDAAMKARILLKHHRCYSCFAFGASCSEQ